MTIFLSALGVAFAACCVWLTVRIVNRRERWAKRTLATVLVSLPMLYLLSFGPACWWLAVSIQSVPGGPQFGDNAAYLPKFYWPIGWAAKRYPALRPALARYSRLFGNRTAVMLPISGSSNEGTILWMLH